MFDAPAEALGVGTAIQILAPRAIENPTAIVETRAFLDIQLPPSCKGMKQLRHPDRVPIPS